MLPERRAEIEQEYDNVVARLSDPQVLSDRRTLKEVSRRHKELEELLHALRAHDAAEEELEVARELFAESEGDQRELARKEVATAEALLEETDAALKALLLPRDPNDGRNVIVSIRGAEGGEESNLFAGSLFEMYQRWSEQHSWKTEVLGLTPSAMGGVDEVTFIVKGEDAWTHLKHEAGAHRVQRVPITESQGRVHTSVAAVTVLPEADEIEIDLPEKDLRIDVYRSTGPGGQSVNTTDSAVRITHIPTGMVVAMQDEKSQIQNRAKALQVLRARLLKAEQDRQAAESSAERKAQIGRGERSDKVRTYNFKENRITDHRIGFTRYNLDRVLLGDLDEVSDALMADERERQLAGEMGE